MRSAALLAAVVICLSPFAMAAVNPIPKVSLSLEQPVQNVTASAQAQNVSFNGTLAVDKLPVERVVITVTAQVDKGWISSVVPETVVFTSATPQTFSCNVTVPAGTNETVGNLTVEATSATGIAQNSTGGQIRVIGSVPGTNQTGNGTGGQNATGDDGTTYGPGGGDSGSRNEFLNLLQNNIWPVSISIALVAAAVAAAGYLRVRSRRKRADEVIEVVND